MGEKLHFTRARLEAIPPPEKGRRYVYDAKTPGLALCITPANGKTFYTIKRIDGKPERIRLGRLSDLTVLQARKAATAILGEAAQGRNPAQVRRAARSAATLGDLWQHVRDTHVVPKLSSKTADDYTIFYKAHLRPWSRRKLAAISKADVARLHARIGADHPHLANRIIGLLSSLYARADELGFAGPNPCRGVRRFPERSRDRFLDADELRKLFAALADAPRTLRDFVGLLLLTGARRSDAQSMKWDQLDMDRRTWRIPQAKGGRPVTIPLVPAVIDLLNARRHIVAGDWVFPGSGRSGHIANPNKAWRKLVDDIGLRGVRFHDLRRTFASWATIAGASLPVVAKMLGHTSLRATEIYARLTDDPIRTSAERGVGLMLAKAGLLTVEADETGGNTQNDNTE